MVCFLASAVPSITWELSNGSKSYDMLIEPPVSVFNAQLCHLSFIHKHQLTMLTLQSGPPPSINSQEQMPDPLGSFLISCHCTINTIAVNALPAYSKTHLTIGHQHPPPHLMTIRPPLTQSYLTDADLAMPMAYKPSPHAQLIYCWRAWYLLWSEKGNVSRSRTTQKNPQTPAPNLH